MNNIVFYYELSSKPNVDIICTILYMCKQHNFEIIFTYIDVLSIEYIIGKGFGLEKYHAIWG